MTTGKTIALTRQTFVGKVMSLLLADRIMALLYFFKNNLYFSCIFKKFIYLAAPGLSCSMQDFNCIMWDLHGGAGTLVIQNVQPQWLQHSELSCSEVCGILVPGPGIEPASPVL